MPESSVPPERNAICPYYSLVTPASQCVGMDMKEPGYFTHRKHIAHLIIIHPIVLHLRLTNLSSA